MIRAFRFEFDRDYGIDRRTGWSVTINGVVYAELIRNPLAALWRGWREYRAACRDMAREERSAHDT